MMTYSFKIRDTATGLFSSGGHHPKWTTKGKTWSTLGHIKSHLHQWRRGVVGRSLPIPDTWQVVTYVSKPTKRQPAAKLIKEKKRS